MVLMDPVADVGEILELRLEESPRALGQSRRPATIRSLPRTMRTLLVLLLAAAALPAVGRASASPPPVLAPEVSVARLVARIKADHVHYVFVGEQHDIGPVKRFAVELANALASSGDGVGLYVEGFRTNCRPLDDACWSLARLFDPQAFATLVERAQVPIHAIDPPFRRGRVAAMATAIAAGHEPIRIVLAGRTHVVDAGDPHASLRVFGGGIIYPDPGDLAEAFPRSERLTVGLVTSRMSFPGYRLRHDGRDFDYLVTTSDVADYWGAPSSPAGAAAAVAITAGGR